jgi:large subunit ribosomal protein L19
MDQRILEFEKQFYKPKLPDIHPGDTVRVHQKVQEGDSSTGSGRGKTRTHQFEGTVIATRHGKGLSGSFTVRKIGAQGVGVEQTFFWHAPTLFKIERIRQGQSRRAKLYYLRGLTAKAGRKLKGVHVGEVWEEEAVKEAVKEEQAAQAASNAVPDEETKEMTETREPTEETKAASGGEQETSQ